MRKMNKKLRDAAQLLEETGYIKLCEMRSNEKTSFVVDKYRAVYNTALGCSWCFETEFWAATYVENVLENVAFKVGNVLYVKADAVKQAEAILFEEFINASVAEAYNALRKAQQEYENAKQRAKRRAAERAKSEIGFAADAREELGVAAELAIMDI